MRYSVYRARIRAGIQGLLPSADDSKVGPIGHTRQAAWSPWTLETGLQPSAFRQDDKLERFGIAGTVTQLLHNCHSHCNLKTQRHSASGYR